MDYFINKSQAEMFSKYFGRKFINGVAKVGGNFRHITKKVRERNNLPKFQPIDPWGDSIDPETGKKITISNAKSIRTYYNKEKKLVGVGFSPHEAMKKAKYNPKAFDISKQKLPFPLK